MPTRPDELPEVEVVGTRPVEPRADRPSIGTGALEEFERISPFVGSAGREVAAVGRWLRDVLTRARSDVDSGGAREAFAPSPGFTAPPPVPPAPPAPPPTVVPEVLPPVTVWGRVVDTLFRRVPFLLPFVPGNTGPRGTGELYDRVTGRPKYPDRIIPLPTPAPPTVEPEPLEELPEIVVRPPRPPRTPPGGTDPVMPPNWWDLINEPFSRFRPYPLIPIPLFDRPGYRPAVDIPSPVGVPEADPVADPRTDTVGAPLRAPQDRPATDVLADPVTMPGGDPVGIGYDFPVPLPSPVRTPRTPTGYVEVPAPFRGPTDQFDPVGAPVPVAAPFATPTMAADRCPPCDCKKKKDKKKKKKSSRTECWQGTYTQLARGITYARKRRVPCKQPKGKNPSVRRGPPPESFV